MHVVRPALLTATLSVLALQFVPAQQPLAPKTIPPRKARAAGTPEVVDVTPASARRPAEVAVAINPNNADHIVAVMMHGGGPGEPRVSNWAYISVDGGMTWKGTPAQNLEQRVQGDDAVVFDRSGTA